MTDQPPPSSLSSSSSSTASVITELADVDLRLLRVRVERQSALSEVEELKAVIKATRQSISEVQVKFQKAQAQYRKDEILLRDERDSLVKRRQELLNFSNYKVQQTAEKEISFAEKALNDKEDLLLNVLESIESLEKLVKDKNLKLSDLNKKFDTLSLGLVDSLEAFEDRELRLVSRRKELIEKLSADVVQTYERSREKYPSDPIALIKGNGCGACQMTVRPQLLLEIRFSGKIIRCSGCSRVLVAGDEKQE
jgi:predicted  nucleic acid-binding Zn-ribbon protein